MRSSALLALLVCFTALASSGFAQTPAVSTGRIDATVLDAQGLPILGAQVTATLPTGNLSRTAASSTERFALEGLAPGVYTLRISAAGFQMQEIQVDLTTQSTQTVEIRLGRPAQPNSSW